MVKAIDWTVVLALARRTLVQYFESLIAYGVAIFMYGLTGGIFAFFFFLNNQGSIQGIGDIAPWTMWFFIPALTMGLISDEIRSGTFEQLSTLPVRDWEIVIGKFLGFAGLLIILVAGMVFYPLMVTFVVVSPPGLDWGATAGILMGIFLIGLSFGAMGLYASALSKNQVVSFLIGVSLTSVFFFLGQLYSFLPGIASHIAEFLSVNTHLAFLNRGVWDLRDIIYFISLIVIFLYLTVQKLTTRRF